MVLASPGEAALRKVLRVDTLTLVGKKIVGATPDACVEGKQRPLCLFPAIKS